MEKAAFSIEKYEFNKVNIDLFNYKTNEIEEVENFNN